MQSSRILSATLRCRTPKIMSSFSGHYSTPSLHRSIFSTTQLENALMGKFKEFFTGKKLTPSDEPSSITLLEFADHLKTVNSGSPKRILGGRISETTCPDKFEKQESIIEYLGRRDPPGENLQEKQKQEAAEDCKCTIADIERALDNFKAYKVDQLRKTHSNKH